MIQLFCGLIMGHNYQILSKNFVPGEYTINTAHPQMRSAVESQLGFLIVGYTTLSMKCERCGKLEFEKFKGKY